MDIAVQRDLAVKAGTNEMDGDTWEERYDYHLGMVENPLPFERFRLKDNLLAKILRNDPDGKDRSKDVIIERLSLELGY